MQIHTKNISLITNSLRLHTPIACFRKTAHQRSTTPSEYKSAGKNFLIRHTNVYKGHCESTCKLPNIRKAPGSGTMRWNIRWIDCEWNIANFSVSCCYWKFSIVWVFCMEMSSSYYFWLICGCSFVDKCFFRRFFVIEFFGSEWICDLKCSM